jgi:hypothetical protein
MTAEAFDVRFTSESGHYRGFIRRPAPFSRVAIADPGVAVLVAQRRRARHFVASPITVLHSARSMHLFVVAIALLRPFVRFVAHVSC